MSTPIVLLVLCAALLHAGWNAAVKASADKALDIVLVTGGAALLSAFALPWLPAPQPQSWPHLAASAGIHVVYFALVGAAYRHGDMSYAYPLMRGLPPLLVALASGALIGEHLPAGAWGGVLLICGGILSLMLVSRRSAAASPKARAATAFALANAVVIAGYTFVDGTGVRLAGSAAAYTGWVFVLCALPLLGWALLRRPADLGRHLRQRWCVGLLGGACTAGGYAMVLLAMAHAPVAMVAALRETAIVFGMGLSALVLKERFGRSRHAAALAILLGAVVLRLA
ncbi:EamA family transporter [Cupriavidus malaysiensis]|uniref:EamA domain-containing protein n=1 Tax=Cupriavidus malaysiensis TaxID=367825 RepID=A0ABM6F871_9BURK|nr:EamA family transporter [Cupriavidus malaysiensis]AOZ07719.1 hypothetical protein BKK80_19210 [Cupriavidus malaysiensis]